jgi:hypothetical protein
MKTIRVFLVMTGEVPPEKVVIKGHGLATASACGSGSGVEEPSEHDKLPTVFPEVDTHSLVEIISDMEWSLSTQNGRNLKLDRASNFRTSVVQLVDVQAGEQPNIKETLVFETTLTGDFVNVGLTVNSNRTDKRYKNKHLQKCYNTVMADEKEYRCGCVLFTEEQINGLSNAKKLSQVVQTNFGGHSGRGWCLNMKDEYSVFVDWTEDNFIKTPWYEPEDRPTFSITGTITSAAVNNGDDGTGKRFIVTESSMDLASTGNSQTWTYAENPSNEYAMPLVGKKTQMFIFEMRIHVPDPKAVCRPFNGECVICLQYKTDFKAARCSHYFCSGCVNGIVLKDDFKCPLCRRVVPAASMVDVSGVPAIEEAATEETATEETATEEIQAMVAEALRTQEEEARAAGPPSMKRPRSPDVIIIED